MATEPAPDMPTDRIVRLMVGRDLAEFFPPRAAKLPGEVLLQVADGGNAVLSGIDLTVRAGEIVGRRRASKARASRRWPARCSATGRSPAARCASTGRAVRAASRARRRSGAASATCRRTASARGWRCSQSLRDNAALTLRAFARALGRPSAGPASTTRRSTRSSAALDVRAARFDDARSGYCRAATSRR